MAAFRRLLLALPAFALFSGLASAQIQVNSALQCVANAGVPPIVRAEGLTELVGDLTLNCNGGVPTVLNAQIPASNIQIFLNTNITSRILASGNWSEALLMIDEPHSTTNPTAPLRVCGDSGTNEVPTNPGVCVMFGTANGQGVYSGSTEALPTTAGACGVWACNARPNVFQGRQVAANSILWAGVPVDPPGTGFSRVIRVTNVRSNANQLGVSSTLVPTQITMFVSITGNTALPINNPTQTVAFIQPGLTGAVRAAGSFLQCISQNRALAVGDATAPSPASYTGSSSAIGNQGFQVVLRADEGFPSSFKKKNIAFVDPAAVGYPANGDQNQNVPGAIYNTESGFENIGPTADPSPNPPDQLVTTSVPATPGFPTVRNVNNAGIANHGTRIMYSFTSVATGTQLWVPVVVRLTSQLTGLATGTAVLTSTDGQGAGGFSRVTANASGLAQISLFNNAGIAVYEVLYSDPANAERLDVPLAIAYAANPGNNLPAPGVQAQVATSFAPLSNVGTASDTAPIPRFAPGAAPRNLFIVNKCNCNLLFPFVSNQLGYDTGVAISNTSLDTGTGFGTTPEQGTVTLNYYCGQAGCSPPPAQTTNAPVPAGQQLTFTLSGGGNYGIAATPGFQGYIIAQSQFRYCHAFAYISAQGALPTTNGASIGYLALVMDPPGTYRPATIGESLGH